MKRFEFMFTENNEKWGVTDFRMIDRDLISITYQKGLKINKIVVSTDAAVESGLIDLDKINYFIDMHKTN